MWILLLAAAAARLGMQAAALPPYMALDEGYHVARLAFVAAEGRNPATDEASIPPYMMRALSGQPPKTEPLAAADLRPYVVPNYEAQHPSLYYSLVAPLVHLLPERTQLGELHLWRAFSVFMALVTVLAIGYVGVQVAGAWGLVAAAVLVSIPTWETLVVRASNDAVTCAAIAVGFAVAFTRRHLIVETLTWAFALAVKFYSWPASVGLFALWWVQRAPWRRRLTVMAVGGAALVASVVELKLRTRNPLGLMFSHTGSEPAPIDWVRMAKITIASFAWTSGPHWNALRPMAIALYLVPPAIVFALVLWRRRREHRDLLLVCLVAAAAFALAQLVNVFAYRRFVTDGLPGAGKEGWYWYALAPLWIGVLLALVLRHLPRVAAIALVAWIVGWDLFIFEGALLQDFGGFTSAANGDAWFRWGPRQWPFTYPAPAGVTVLRVVQIAATVALVVQNERRRVAAAP
jgi:hypothetical protein